VDIRPVYILAQHQNIRVARPSLKAIDQEQSLATFHHWAFRLWPDFPPLLAPQESEQPLISLGLRLACHAEGRGFEPRRSRHFSRTWLAF
jgi:hypothetical protein